MKQSNPTKIIATLGPASWKEEGIRSLIQAGADCFRINFSHADADQVQPLVDRVRKVSAEEGVFIPILADIQGPKLRIGKMPVEGVLLVEGERFTLTGRTLEEGTVEAAQSQYEKLAADVRPGTKILLSDGTIELEVEAVKGQDVICQVTSGGRLYSNKGINIPRTKLSVETLTEKDRRDLRFVAKSGIDIAAISFVRSPNDIVLARNLLGGSKVPVMAKLELPEVLDNLEAILAVADGVMVARGDLAVELPFEQVPALQKQILRRASARGKWAIVATQMLGSMVLNRRPTRAEVSDVANAVLDGADALMLSEETATGNHSSEAVQAMVCIAREAEAFLDRPAQQVFEEDIISFAAGAAGAAVNAADRLNAKAIVTLAGSGHTALLLSKWRPEQPILAMSAKESTLRRLNVLRGVVPVPLSDWMTMEEQIRVADDYLVRHELAEPGDTAVVVAAIPLGEKKDTNTIRFHHVRSPGHEG